MLIEHDRGKSVRSTGFFIAFEQGNELSMISRSDLRNCVHDDRTAFDCLISQGYIQLAEHLELNSLALEIDILKCRCAQLIVWKRITYQQCLLPRFFYLHEKNFLKKNVSGSAVVFFVGNISDERLVSLEYQEGF